MWSNNNMPICCTSYSACPVLLLLLEHMSNHPGDLNTSVNDFIQQELNAPRRKIKAWTTTTGTPQSWELNVESPKIYKTIYQGNDSKISA